MGLMAHGLSMACLIVRRPARRGQHSQQRMAMLMAQRPVGERGTLGLRSMISLDPLMAQMAIPCYSRPVKPLTAQRRWLIDSTRMTLHGLVGIYSYGLRISRRHLFMADYRVNRHLGRLLSSRSRGWIT